MDELTVRNGYYLADFGKEIETVSRGMVHIIGEPITTGFDAKLGCVVYSTSEHVVAWLSMDGEAGIAERITVHLAQLLGLQYEMLTPQLEALFRDAFKDSRCHFYFAPIG